MVAAMSTHLEKRLYPPQDAADNVSCRPDFAIALYPGHLAVSENSVVMNPDIRVTSKTPPTFLLQAEDDPVDPVQNSIIYHAALRKAGVPVEMHLFVSGGHAFGMRRTTSPITGWPSLVEISNAASLTVFAIAARLFLLMRAVGPEMLMPPATLPFASRMAAPTHRAPATASSSSSA